jgi:hypothetical protein
MVFVEKFSEKERRLQGLRGADSLRGLCVGKRMGVPVDAMFKNPDRKRVNDVGAGTSDTPTYVFYRSQAW